ncbi:NEL-type E3 ubiquitin ligase domain-containing protein [Pseudomonas granadensis]|uniref:NEL-type E3 ubiquitin ligase domain-containing protein n=1 Tax=Pseudomonas granadensis TaxID=1421430 RepID=UPI00087A7691|nr:NEL-type E3 ubiquitin ligase domain-containing protein [Pseudomonas granadensis]SDS20221.1 Leucine Rich Repeat [Pseudomonas granadensis]
MPIKSPPKGNTSGSAGVRPAATPDVTTPRADTTLRPGFDSFGLPTRPHPPASGADLDAITPAPAVMVHPSTSLHETPRAVGLPLEHYRVTAAVGLPAVNAEGLRIFKGRQYVDVVDVGIVQVVRDAETGLFQARLPSESKPSGPVLLRDPDSGLWHPQEDFEPITFALSDTRMAAFRTTLAFNHAEPGSDGLHRFDGKLYALIDNHAYQVMRDPDASTPVASVMRIVRSDDPVASDSANLYVATRPGRSEPIVFDAIQGWVGITVAGAGGMMRGDGNVPARSSMRERLSQTLNRLRSPQSRARKLFPDHTDEEIGRYIESLGSDVSGGLTQRENAYKSLKSELDAWLRQTANAAPPGTSPVHAQQIAQSLKRCWRHQTGAILWLEAGNSTLPALQADLRHVRHLTLQSVDWSDAASTLLGNFSGLEGLHVSGSTLDTLPAALVQMKNLNSLDLSSNRLVLNEQTSAELSSLTQLKHLDLSGNPLGNTPNFSAMVQLKTLNLSDAQLHQWPAGLHSQTRLTHLDLRNNRLTAVPEANLNPPTEQFDALARINSVTLLEGNPFPPGYWTKLEDFWQRVAIEQPELGNAAVAEAFRLPSDMPETADAKRVYPDKNPRQLRAFLLALNEDGKAQLARRVAALDSLQSQLGTYVDGNPPDSSGADTPARVQARRVADIIQACWLDSTHTLRLPLTKASLPPLSADFSHVKALFINAATWSGDAETFLSGFPNLERLVINHCRLKSLPDAIAAMDKLIHLDLASNRMQLTVDSATALSAMSQLEAINLSDNSALGLTPDFSGMSGLRQVLLNHTGIKQWPRGLQDKTELTTLDLSNNRLKEVPPAFIDPPAEQLLTVARINAVTQLTGNRFPAGYGKKFDDFWKRVSQGAPDLLATPHFDSDNSLAQRYRRLFPNKNMKQCREYLWSLDADAAPAKVRSLEREFKVLKRQLDDWVFSGGGNLGGYIRADQLALNAQTRADRVTASHRIISCWRQETPQRHANDGTPIGLELDLSDLRLPSLPDLDVDFTHVGSLVLRNMNLSTSPEGFLTRFRHIRWLDLSRNRLRELPPAVGEMHGLTRLSLERNFISLTADTARVLAARTTLRALELQENPQLGIVPDLSGILDLRTVSLAYTGIDTFPTGILNQPLLDTINLNDNRITEIPDAVIAPPNDQLANTVRINNITDISNNPLSDATYNRLINYRRRLRAAGTPLTGTRNLIDTASVRRPPPFRRATADPLVRWTAGLSDHQVATRTRQWQTLRDQPRSDGLFNTLERLKHTGTGHPQLQARVWMLIDSITENTPQSERLRNEVFDRAGDAACCDRAAFTFANLETAAMMHNAVARAGDKSQGPELFKLSRALFRLHEVDKIASADIAQREASIVARRTAQEAALPPPHVSEEVEIRLFYRHGLKDRLQLPGQPEEMGFAHLAGVSKAQLESAYQTVIARDNSAEEFQALVSREFWQKYLTHKFQENFETRRQPFQDRQAALDESFAANELSFADYDAQSKTMQAEWMIEEAALIETLSRQELAQYKASGTEEEAAGTSAS